MVVIPSVERVRVSTCRYLKSIGLSCNSPEAGKLPFIYASALGKRPKFNICD
jgi:hypothetical protein